MPDTANRWTADRVRALPDDGSRYELIAGELLVTPAPGRLHQVALLALFSSLQRHLADGHVGSVYLSPADLRFGDDEIAQPDLFVFRGSGGSGDAWAEPATLLLVAEVLSSSTAMYDRGLKRLRYQRARIPEYWIVDLDARLIERWLPDDARPEILRESLSWTPAPGAATMELDLPGFFATVLGTDA
jgi:Uma2 family endonuclease